MTTGYWLQFRTPGGNWADLEGHGDRATAEGRYALLLEEGATDLRVVKRMDVVLRCSQRIGEGGQR